MAEAIARHDAPDVIEPSSAGLVPLGYIVAPTVAALAERGISSGGQTSKRLTGGAVDAADLLVNMSGQPLSPLAKKSARVEDWDVEDPYGEDAEVYRRICDGIRLRVQDLAQRIRDGRLSVTQEPNR
jgi:arsenate reductase